MKLKLLAAVAVVAAGLAPAALADDPLAAVTADLAKAQSDFKAAHDTLLADAQKLQGDAALVKPGNKDQAKAAIQADWQQLKSDFEAKRSVMRASRARRSHPPTPRRSRTGTPSRRRTRNTPTTTNGRGALRRPFPIRG